MENMLLLGGLSAASMSLIALSSPECAETRWYWDRRKLYEKVIVFPSWFHPSAAKIKLLTHTPWLFARTRSPKYPVGGDRGFSFPTS